MLSASITRNTIKNVNNWQNEDSFQIASMLVILIILNPTWLAGWDDFRTFKWISLVENSEEMMVKTQQVLTLRGRS